MFSLRTQTHSTMRGAFWLSVCLAVLAGPLLATDEWQGERTVQDGVVHITNPQTPLGPPVVYELRELWRLPSETDDGELVYGTIDAAVADADGNLYLLDAQLMTVHVISPAGEYLRAIGRGGEGPGEFDDPTDLFLVPGGGVAVVDTRCVLLFNRQGTPMGNWTLTVPEYVWHALLHVFPVPAGYLVSLKGRGRKADGFSYIQCLAALFDHAGQLGARLAQRSWIIRREEPFLFDEESTEAFSFIAARANGTVYLSPTFSAYRVRVFDPTGGLRMVIERDYEPVRRTAEDIADLQAHWRNVYARVKQLTLRIREQERNITALYPRADGSLWVETSRGWDNLPAGVADILDVFDSEGRFVRRAILRKEIDTANDLLFIMDDKVLIATAGYAAYMTAGGTSSENLRRLDRAMQIPTVILCELVPQP